jgi:hypothetical protein
VPIDDDLEPIATSPCAVNEKSIATIHTPNIMEAASAQSVYARLTNDRPSPIGTGADAETDGSCFGCAWHSRRGYQQTEGKAQ